MSSNQPDASSSAVNPASPDTPTNPTILLPEYESIHDTPIKSGKTLSPKMHGTLKKDVDAEIDAVINMGHCHVTNSRAFLKAVLPVNTELINQHMATLKDKGTLEMDKDKKWQWKGFPKAAAKEKEFYDPLTLLANTLCLEGKKSGGLNVHWGNLHNKSPDSGNTEASELRPDIARTALADWRTLKAELVKLKDEIAAFVETPDADTKKRKLGETDKVNFMRLFNAFF